MRVTIGMPFYNSEQTLVDAIRSVFAQTCEDWELLLVDDGSTDGSLNIARSVDDPRVKVISDGANRGLAYRLNQISRLAEGEYVARMDSDDVMHPQRLAKQIEFLDGNPMVDVADTGAYTIGAAGSVMGIRKLGPVDSRPISVLRAGLLCHPTVMGRAEWFRGNPYREDFVGGGEDYELWCRTCRGSTFARLQQPLMYYREAHKEPWSHLRYYLHAARLRRRSLMMHGPTLAGWIPTGSLVLTTIAKGEVFRAATVLGMQTAVIGARSDRLEGDEYRAAAEALERVRATPVPGLLLSDSVSARTGRNVSLLHTSTVPSTLFFLNGQTEFMRSRGFDISVLSSPDSVLESLHQEQRIPVYGVEMPRRITPVHDLFALRRIHHIMRDVRPDIVHAHTPKGGLLGTIAAWFARVPIRIYHIRGLPFVTATGYKRRLLTMSEKMSCRLATQVLCVSYSVRELLISEGLCPAWKVKVLRYGSMNGVSAERRFNPAHLAESTRGEVRAEYGIPDDARVIGFVGRIVRDKGLSELAEAWQILRDRYPDLHMIVVGPFEPQDPVSPETEHVLRTDERIHLTGLQGDIPRLYRAMDIVALPTYREGFNNTLLEAAAMELPAVTSAVPGCTDVVVDGVTATLVPPRDGRALADALARYLDDPEMCRRHARAARERVLRDFRPEDMWESLYQEYQRLLGQSAISVSKAAVCDETSSSVEAN